MGARILLAEDSKINRMILSRMIESAGHTADCAEDGKIAAEKAAASSYDLILMDIYMPVMNGPESAREIRRLGVKTPIVALSADDISEEKALGMGMDGVAPKPLTKEGLGKLLERFVVVPGPVSAPEIPAVLPACETGAHPPEVFDMAAGLSFAGKQDLLREYIDLFTANTPANIARLAKAISDGDAAKAKSAAHLIKGESKSLGAMRLAETASLIEKSAKDGKLVEAGNMTGKLQAEFAEFADIASERMKK